MNRLPLRAWATVALCTSAAAASAADGLTFYGYTGLLNVPTASTTPEGYLDVLYSEASPDGIDYDEDSNFFFSLGLLDRVELAAGLAYARSDGRDRHNDLSAAVKGVLIDRYHWMGANWSVAAGWADFSGESENTTRFEARYLTSTVEYKTLGLTLGYGAGPDRLDGAFGGIAWSPHKSLTLLADSDSEYHSLGVRLAFDASDVVRLYALARQSSADEGAEGYGAGGRFNLRFGRTRRWFQPESGHGLRNVRLGTSGNFQVVRAENAAYLQRQQDSASAACQRQENDQIVEYWQYRYGIPLLRSILDCETGRYTATAWLPQWLPQEPQWQGRAQYPVGLELRLGVEERSFVAADQGRLNYSAAAQGSVRLQASYGLGAYATYNQRIAETEPFEPGGAYNFYRTREGMREYAGQLAVHPVNGLIGVGTLGRTWVNAIEYDFGHVEAVYYWGHGNHRTRVVSAEYTPTGSQPYPTRELLLFSHRYWLDALNTFFEIGGGDYFYGDSGTSLQITRFFGDVSVQLFARLKDEDERIAGVGFSVPLTPKLGFQRGPVSVVGMPRFSYAKSTSFGNDSPYNVLRPTLLIEPRPIYNLTTDWLDSDRTFPAYAAYSNE